MNEQGKKKHLIPFSWLLFFFIVGNLLFLDYWIMAHKDTITVSQIRTAISSPPAPTQQRFTIDEEKLKKLCGEECVSAIYKELESATQSSSILTTDICRTECIAEIYRIIKEATASSTRAVGFAPTETPVQTQSFVKEIFIPFGSGSSTASDWTDVAGLQTTIDTADYPSIKQVFFEATLRIPTGNQTAYARLYNATDKHPVWYSDVSLEGGTPKLLISQPITLDAGNKTYQIQMRTSLQYQTNIDQARIRLKLQ